MNKKAFTLIEVMIVAVIIGLIAAMFIPAYHKIRENSLVKAHEKGEKLNKKQMGIVQEYYKRMTRDKTPQPSAVESAPNSNAPILIPADEITEVYVNGTRYYVWSKK